MKAIFVAGTDTGVGKTIVTGCLARYLVEQGYNVITQKWIQTGCVSFSSSDMATHLEIMGHDKRAIKEYLSFAMPYMFKKGASPHLACRLEGKKIEMKKIREGFRSLAKKFDFVIVEGVGGVLVPYSRKQTVIDIVKGLNLPVLLVAGNKLGAINHTLLAIEALRSRGLKILGVIFDNIKKGDRQVLEDNPKIIREFSGEKVFGALPYEASYKKLYKKFLPLGEAILRELKGIWISGLRRT